MGKSWKEETARRLRGLDRAAHFSAGGTLEGWRGVHLVEIDRKKEERRLQCRRGNHLLAPLEDK